MAPGKQPGDYPAKQKFWKGDEFFSLGSGIYHKKIAFVSLQIYTVAVYVEYEAAVAKAKQLKQSGYFQNKIDVCDFINQPGFKKVLHIKLLRDVGTARFISEMSKDLGPRCAKTGDLPSMKIFTDYLQDKQIKTGSSLVCLWDETDTLGGGLYPAGFSDWAGAQPILSLQNVNFCTAMFGMYIDAESVVPENKKIWSKSILALAQ